MSVYFHRPTVGPSLFIGATCIIYTRRFEVHASLKSVEGERNRMAGADGTGQFVIGLSLYRINRALPLYPASTKVSACARTITLGRMVWDVQYLPSSVGLTATTGSHNSK